MDRAYEHYSRSCDAHSLPTFVFAECVLSYVEKEKTEALLAWISKMFSACFFANYEPINPMDPFGQVMMSHLRVTTTLPHRVAP